MFVLTKSPNTDLLKCLGLSRVKCLRSEAIAMLRDRSWVVILKTPPIWHATIKFLKYNLKSSTCNESSFFC